MPPHDLLTDPLLRDAPVVEGFKVLAPCALYAVVGQGGMGVVYRGRHLNLDIDVAVKCMRPGLVEVDPDAVTRFQREARIAARIHHQNLVHVYDVSSQNGLHYLVMEFVQGETARARVQRKGALREREAATIVLGAARGLAEAHNERIVHRDIKPDNVLISADGRVKVSDLGIAKAIDQGEGTALTRGVMGTPQYMSPEQWVDTASVGVQSDVWSLGAVLWYLLAGEDAIPRGTIQESYLKVCVQPFPDLSARKAGVSAELLRILGRCLQKQPEERYASAHELARALEDYLGDAENLGDSDTGTLKAPETLVSPPPAGTLARIRTHVGRGEAGGALAPTIPFDAGATAGAAARGGAAAEPGPTRALTIPLPRSRKAIGLVALAAVALAAVLIWALGGGSRPRAPAGDPDFARNWIQALRVDGAPVEIDANGRAEVWTAKSRVSLAADLADDRIEYVDVAPGNRQPVTLEVDDEAVKYDLQLDGGMTRIAFSVSGSRPLEYRLEVNQDSAAPRIDILAPKAGLVVATPDLPLSVRAQDDALLDVAAGGRSLSATRRSGEFEGSVALQEGANRVVVTATDRAGNRAEQGVDVVLDTRGPEVRLVAPRADEVLQAGARVQLEFEFSEPVQSFLVGGSEVGLSADGRKAACERAVPAIPGRDAWSLEYVARDGVKNATSGSLPWKVAPLANALVPAGWEVLDPNYGAEGWARKVRDPASGVTFVLIEAGSFLMGTPGKGGVLPEESPAHVVDIARPFYLGLTEVTVAQWRAFADSTGYRSQAEQKGGSKTVDTTGSWYTDATASWRNPFPKHKLELLERMPVSSLSFTDAVRFCDHYGLRLPTEAEWEYAARAGTQTAFWWGDDQKRAQGNANLSDQWARERFSAWTTFSLLIDGFVFAAPVEVFTPNPWGLCDMVGNVWEWCADAYQVDAYKQAGRDGQKPFEGAIPRVLRGGSWFNIPDAARSASRHNLPPDAVQAHVGFRVAKTP